MFFVAPSPFSPGSRFPSAAVYRPYTCPQRPAALLPDAHPSAHRGITNMPFSPVRSGPRARTSHLIPCWSPDALWATVLHTAPPPSPLSTLFPTRPPSPLALRPKVKVRLSRRLRPYSRPVTPQRRWLPQNCDTLTAPHPPADTDGCDPTAFMFRVHTISSLFLSLPTPRSPLCVFVTRG